MLAIAALLSGALTITPAVTRPAHGYRSVNLEISTASYLVNCGECIRFSFGLEHLAAVRDKHPNITGLFVGYRLDPLPGHRFSVVPAVWIGATGVQYAASALSTATQREQEGWHAYARLGLLGRIRIAGPVALEAGPTYEYSNYDFESHAGLGWRVGLAFTP